MNGSSAFLQSFFTFIFREFVVRFVYKEEDYER